MKFILLLFSIIFFTFIVEISCYNLPDESYYNTTRLWGIRDCERKFKLSDDERQFWWSWKVPPNPTKCFAQCVFHAIGWYDSNGRFNLARVQWHYRQMGHRITPNKYKMRRCMRRNDPCNNVTYLWKCFLDFNARGFMDTIQLRIAKRF
uniref:D7-related protein n=1 Tax=Culicoides sonorensis TaxID=179676 RepID=Q66U59_CULSO|nr:D7-related protein [Culicoides sonorensis]